jgi:hypothetical protein
MRGRGWLALRMEMWARRASEVACEVAINVRSSKPWRKMAPSKLLAPSTGRSSQSQDPMGMKIQPWHTMHTYNATHTHKKIQSKVIFDAPSANSRN